MSGLDRRSFISTGITGGVLAASGLGIASSALAAAPDLLPARSATRRARNVIFMVADGMSLGTLVLAGRYLRRHAGRDSHWLNLYSLPGVRRALNDSASANSLVTDSAAASSAWGGGARVNNGAINLRPDGSFSTPIMELAAKAGLGTGLVSTATITHATPAGFAAKVPLRADEDVIARQYLERRIDVLLGGGLKFFAPATRPEHDDLLSEYKASGYTIVRDSAGLSTAPASGRLLGLFSEGHIPYSLDRANDPALASSVPTLSEMARVALSRLSATPAGFILQIEGARVDHGAHANDIGALLHDQIAFDEAVGAVLEWARDRDDTLVVITSDHGNSNPALNGTGKAYGDTNAAFDRLTGFRHTNTWVLERLSASSTPADIRALTLEATGIELNSEDLALLARALRGEHREGYRVRNEALITYAQVLANYISIGWTGISHTSDFTEMAAFGPGSEPIKGIVRNSDMYGIMARALGLPLPA